MLLDDKVCLITGSSRGFGAKIAEVMAREGARIVVTFLEGDNEEKENARRVAEKIGSTLVVPIDIRKRASVRNAVERIVEEYSRIDILVNNAGINRTADFDKQTEEDWHDVLETNLKGTFICSQECLPHIPEGGRIINIGSVSGQYGGPRTPSYACAKAGVMALTHNMARFAGERNITVNCVSPGMISSEMLTQTMSPELQQKLLQDVPLKRYGTMDEVAETVAFIASQGAGYISGQTIGVNGGLWVSGF
ncbi:3-oxoacyl-ACP reductase family protein [Marinobacteraceae bacterium S3BR75-40.1]